MHELEDMTLECFITMLKVCVKIREKENKDSSNDEQPMTGEFGAAVARSMLKRKR